MEIYLIYTFEFAPGICDGCEFVVCVYFTPFAGGAIRSARGRYGSGHGSWRGRELETVAAFG